MTTPPVLSPPEQATSGGAGDVRQARPWLLFGRPLRSLVRRLASIVTLLFLDVSGLALGVYGSLVLRELWHGNTPIVWGVLWDAPESWLPFVTLVTLLVFWRAGLYAPRETRAGAGAVLASLALVAILTVVFALGTGHDFATYGIVPTAVALTAIFIGLFRWSYESLTGDVMRVAGVRRKALLVGEGEHVRELQRALGSSRGGIDYDFVGSTGDFDELPVILERMPLDELIVADAGMHEDRLLGLVEHAHRRGVKVRVAPRTTELLVQRGEYIPGQGVPLFELRPPVLAGTDWAVKRAFDLVVSALVLVVGLPFWLAIAAAIKLTSRGPVLYRDRRIGVNEDEFLMLKFRTMVAGADELQPELEPANEAPGALFKLRNDPRVTPVGRFLRRFSIDEIPQVLNVLRGQMSLVGPRPLPIRDFVRLEEWHRKRYLVLPGMTGLWQISGRSDLSFDDLVRLDFYYLENWSLLLDITILFKTIPAVLTQKGAY